MYRVHAPTLVDVYSMAFMCENGMKEFDDEHFTQKGIQAHDQVLALHSQYSRAHWEQLRGCIGDVNHAGQRIEAVNYVEAYMARRLAQEYLSAVLRTRERIQAVQKALPPPGAPRM